MWEGMKKVPVFDNRRQLVCQDPFLFSHPVRSRTRRRIRLPRVTSSVRISPFLPPICNGKAGIEIGDGTLGMVQDDSSFLAYSSLFIIVATLTHAMFAEREVLVCGYTRAVFSPGRVSFFPPPLERELRRDVYNFTLPSSPQFTLFSGRFLSNTTLFLLPFAHGAKNHPD